MKIDKKKITKYLETVRGSIDTYDKTVFITDMMVMGVETADADSMWEGLHKNQYYQ